MIEDIANYLHLRVWDWIAVLIALLSLVIASFSLFIAKGTLKSQRQTEKNTLPIINVDIQEFQFCELITRLLDGHMKMTAIWHLLHGKSFKFYVPERILRMCKIPLELVHIELFYNHYTNYRAVQGLIDMINDYNICIDMIEIQCKDIKIENETLSKEFFHLLYMNDMIANAWSKVMTIIFHYDYQKTASVFKKYVENISDEKMKKDFHPIFYKQKEIYSDYFESDDEKRKMLIFMEEETKGMYEVLSNCLIERK